MEFTMNITDDQLSALQMLGFIDANLPLDEIQTEDVQNAVSGLIEDAADRQYAAPEPRTEMTPDDKSALDEINDRLNARNEELTKEAIRIAAESSRPDPLTERLDARNAELTEKAIEAALKSAAAPPRPQISFDNADLQKVDVPDVEAVWVVDNSTAQDILPEISARAVTEMKAEAVQTFAEAMDAFMAKYDIQNYSERFTDGMHYTDAIANDMKSGHSDWIRDTLQSVLLQNITKDPNGKEDITCEAADLHQKFVALADSLENPERANITAYTTEEGTFRVCSDELLKGFGMMDVEIPLSPNEKASLDAAVEEAEKSHDMELE